MSTLANDLERTKRAREHFEDLIQNPEQLGPDFQPIRRLSDDVIVGWHAVGRGNLGPEFADRATFARTAVSLGLAERLDWTFRCRVFDVAAEHGVTEPVHVRPAFASYGSVPPPRLAVAFGRARTLKVVAEVHADAYDNPAELAIGLEEFRRWGWSINVGDIADRVDAGSILQKVRPAYAGVDLSRPERAQADSVKRFVDTARRLGVEVLATGLDSPLRPSEAAALGAVYGRGSALGAPAALPA